MKLVLSIPTKSIYGRTEKSSIAEHALEADHIVTLDIPRIIKDVSDRRLLNAYEWYRNCKT